MILVTLLILLFVLAQPATALEPPGTVVFSDNFNDGFSKWRVARGYQDMWTITNGVLQGEVIANNTITELVPLPSFWSDDWRHYELEWDMKPIAGADRNIAWGYQDANNWYEVHFLPTVFEFAKKKNATVAWHKSGNYQLTPGVWHHLKLRTAGGQLQLFINEVLVFDYLDPDYIGNAGTIALKVGTGSTAPSRVQFDNITVRLVADPRQTSLALPQFRQDDRVWAETIYDTATAWAGTEPPTIERWGCALTSAVMVLRFHGFTQLLDGTPITPLSLNNWLLSQSDGYVAQGWVNWIALMRLVKLLRIEWSTPEFPLPQLRYVYQGWTDWETEGKSLITAEIQAGRPTILELPRHFVVSHGVVGDGDFQIADPASDKTKLSQGFAAPTSARFWHAETGDAALDLSYWLIVFPKGLRIKLFTSDGEQILRWWLSQDLPGSNESDVGPENWLALTVPQPPPGESFRLEIAPAQGDPSLDGGEFPYSDDYVPYQPYTVQLYRYDTAANVTPITLQGNLGTMPQTWEVTSAGVHQILDWSNLIQELNQMEHYGLIAPFANARLKQVAQFAHTTDQIDAPTEVKTQTNHRYLAWLRNVCTAVLDFDNALLRDAARNYLESWLGQYNIRLDV